MSLYEQEHIELEAAWAEIKEAQKKERVLRGARVVGIERHRINGNETECLVVMYNGIKGLIPRQAFDDYQLKGLTGFLNRIIEFCVETYNVEMQMFIGNRVKALKKLQQIFFKLYKKGDVVNAFVRGVDAVNVYLLVDGFPCKMHRNDFSWTYHEDLSMEIALGSRFDVRIMDLELPQDGKEGRITVSKKALEKDPFEQVKNLRIKSEYVGQVKQIHEQHGYFIELYVTPNFVVRSNFPPGAHRLDIQVGDSVAVKIMDIDYSKREVKTLLIMNAEKPFATRGGRRR
ncbi:hypothetical protein [Niallia taxi]|uniref:hypothetical protein n=1 Tax=Niallia taxi TaxID=2499688 RepID=UPI0015F69365|nr:hypothetical protein [Niallia taxi]